MKRAGNANGTASTVAGSGGSGSSTGSGGESQLAPFTIPSAAVLLSTAGGGADHYTALGFSGAHTTPMNAPKLISLASIRAAYRALALHYHPDKHAASAATAASSTSAHKQSAQSAAACFIRISSAYHALKDVDSREAYDSERLQAWLLSQPKRASASAHYKQPEPEPEPEPVSTAFYYNAGASLFAAPSYQQPAASAASPPKPKPKPKPTPAATPITPTASAAAASASASTAPFSFDAMASALGDDADGDGVLPPSAAALRIELDKWKRQWTAEVEADKRARADDELSRYARQSSIVEAKLGRKVMLSAAATASTPRSNGSSASASSRGVSAAIKEMLTLGTRCAVKTAAASKPPPAIAAASFSTGSGRGAGRGRGAAAAPVITKAARTASAAAALTAKKAVVYVSIWVSAELDRLQWRLSASSGGGGGAAPDGIIPVRDISSVTKVSTDATQCWFVVRSAAKTLTLQANSSALCTEWVNALSALIKS